jgi:hypothetical protein
VTSLLIALGIVVVVGAAAVVLRRRQVVDAPTQKEWTVPTQIDPADLGAVTGIASASWSIAVFTSASCHVCADVVGKARVLQSPQVNVMEFEYGAHRALHDKYRIDAVPTLVVVDADGVVRRHFLGPVTATDLWAAVAQTRDPVAESGGDCSSR